MQKTYLNDDTFKIWLFTKSRVKFLNKLKFISRDEWSNKVPSHCEDCKDEVIHILRVKIYFTKIYKSL